MYGLKPVPFKLATAIDTEVLHRVAIREYTAWLKTMRLRGSMKLLCRAALGKRSICVSQCAFLEVYFSL